MQEGEIQATQRFNAKVVAGMDLPVHGRIGAGYLTVTAVTGVGLAPGKDATIGYHVKDPSDFLVLRSKLHVVSPTGGYDVIAEKVFALHADRLLLEYDTERVGSFEALRSVPPDKVVVLGLVSTKVAKLESKDNLRRRIDAASAFVPLERLALSAQCGFASDFRGNPLSEGDQWRKLEFVASVANEIWGGVAASI